MASDSETQQKSLPGFVHLPDEIVLLFDEAYILFDQVIEAGLVTEKQITSIKTLEAHLQIMQKEKKEIWTKSAMEENGLWLEMRILAKNSLMTFGIDIQNVKPDIDWATYIRKE